MTRSPGVAILGAVLLSAFSRVARIGVKPGLSRVDSSRVLLLNALTLVISIGALSGLLAPSTWTEPVYLIAVLTPILGGVAIFLLQARGRLGAAAVVFLAIGFLITLLPVFLVTPWSGHVFTLLPLAALPWLLVTSQRFILAFALSALAMVLYILIVNVYALTFDIRAAQRGIGDFAVYNMAIYAFATGLIGHFMRRITVSAELSLERERLQSARLVQAMLPLEIAEAALAGQPTPARRHGDASVLFCAIDDFDRIVAEEEGERLVSLLDEVFGAFDDLCASLGVEKIKTYGEHYLAVAGIPAHRSDHAEALATLALEMHRSTVGTCTSRGTPLRLRIGINSGPLVAGVIGQMQLTYDVWGDTVNLAQRMEAHGEPGDTQVTPITFAKINHRFVCAPRPPLPIKGRDPMKTYWLRGERPQ